MKRVSRLWFLPVILAANGCTLTLNSIFTGKDATYDPLLEGVWQNADATWTVKSHGHTGKYALTLQETAKDETKVECYATLGVIGTNRFLEVTPVRPNTMPFKSVVGWQFVAMHSFWRVEKQDDKLVLTSMSTGWLRSMIDHKRTDIRHGVTSDGLIVLTATTDELQAFLARYVGDSAAFPTKGEEKGIVFVRANGASPAQGLEQTDSLPWTPPRKWEEVKP